MAACQQLLQNSLGLSRRSPPSLCLSQLVLHTQQRLWAQADLQAQGPQLCHLLLQGCLHVRHLSLQGRQGGAPQITSGRVQRCCRGCWQHCRPVAAPAAVQAAAQGSMRQRAATLSSHNGLIPAAALTSRLARLVSCLRRSSCCISSWARHCACSQQLGTCYNQGTGVPANIA